MLLAERILAPGGLTVRFQPVVRLAGETERLHGVEALVHGPVDSHAARSDVLFDYVRRKRLESVMDRACVEAVMVAAGALPPGLRLSLNVFASTLGHDAEFPAFLAARSRAAGLDPGRLTVEIVEQSRCWDGVRFQRALGALRGHGMRIALDDVGLGFSNFAMILDTPADYLKIDRHFVRGAPADRRRRIVLESIARLAHELGSLVIAEGVETAAERDLVTEIGIPLAQGFLFGAPRPAAELTGAARAA
jgi:EAL domain-containing protein (putative c-di-GMP-specific phosphodiesterase class I)